MSRLKVKFRTLFKNYIDDVFLIRSHREPKLNDKAQNHQINFLVILI